MLGSLSQLFARLFLLVASTWRYSNWNPIGGQDIKKNVENFLIDIEGRVCSNRLGFVSLTRPL